MEEKADAAGSTGFASDVSKLFREIFGWAAPSDVAPTPVAAVEDVWLSSADEMAALEMAALQKLEEKAALEELEEEREAEEERERECIRIGDRVAAIIVARGIALAAPRPLNSSRASAGPSADAQRTPIPSARGATGGAHVQAAKPEERDVVELGRRCAAAFVSRGIAMVNVMAAESSSSGHLAT